MITVTIHCSKRIFSIVDIRMCLSLVQYRARQVNEQERDDKLFSNVTVRIASQLLINTVEFLHK
jgi:hypothetical protein